ncbi:unnamed protein product, partial [Heterosigma akashiwo]
MIPFVLLMVALQAMPLLKADADLGSLVQKSDKCPFDGGALAAGFATIMCQFPHSCAATFFRYT